MHKRPWLVPILLLAIFACSWMLPACAGEDGEESTLPDMIAISTYGIGSSAYTYSSMMVECVEDAVGMKVKCVPIEEEFSRFAALLKGEVDYQWQPAGGWYNVSRGFGEYEKLGDVRVRCVWKGAGAYYSFAVRANSDINDFGDIKGKRVAWVATPTIQASYENLLAYGGLTWDDVVKVPMPSYTAAMTALLEGSIDVSTATHDSPTMYELASSPSGLRWLSVDRDNTEAYAKIKEITPFYSWVLVEQGAGITEDNPIGMLVAPNIIGTVAGNVADEVTYAFVKGLWESYDCYKDKHEALARYDHETALEVFDIPVPFDPAAVQYFKDIGVWTDEMEAAQLQLLADEDERCALPE